jgi:hypothetical protein
MDGPVGTYQYLPAVDAASYSLLAAKEVYNSVDGSSLDAG